MDPRPAYAATWPQPEVPLAIARARHSLRPREIAKLTGLSPAKVYASIYSGALVAYQVGKAWIVPVEAFNEWIGTGKRS